MNKSVIFLLLVYFGMNSCKEDKVEQSSPLNSPTVEINVQPVFGSLNLQENGVYSTVEGYDVKFTELKFYFTNIANGNNVLTDAALFDWMLTGTSFIRVEGNKNNFSNLSGNLGVGASDNHADPSAFANSSALNIANANDMHWDWNPGYIFVKVEGKADTIADGNPLFDHNIVFHVGLDVNLQTWSLNNLNWVTIDANTSRTTLKIDLATFLQNNGQNIDLKTEFSSHSAPGQEVISLKVIENFNAAIGKL